MSSTPEQDATPYVPAAVMAHNPVLGEGGSWHGLPVHFGWPSAEQEAYEEGRGLAFLGPLGVVRVTGPDRLSWLTTLSSQVVSDLEPGVSKELLILDPQGRVDFAAGVIDDGESAWLLTEPQFAVSLAEYLQSMKFMLRVEIADVSGDYVGFGTVGAGPAENFAGSLLWDDPWPGVAAGGAAYFQGTHPGGRTPLRVFAVPVQGADAFVEAQLRALAGAGESAMVGLIAADATRIAAWRPRASHEVDDRTLPAELDWLRTAVHTDKGCYRGQESVARIINLGKPPRRLVFLQLDGSGAELPELGDAVELDGRKVGVVTSVGQHFEMGPIALALVKRNLDPTVQLKIGEVDAAQEIIVPVDGRSDHAPASRPGVGLKRLDPGKRDIRTTGPGAGR